MHCKLITDEFPHLPEKTFNKEGLDIAIEFRNFFTRCIKNGKPYGIN